MYPKRLNRTKVFTPRWKHLRKCNETRFTGVEETQEDALEMAEKTYAKRKKSSEE